MLPKIQKPLHNRTLMFSMATVTNEALLKTPSLQKNESLYHWMHAMNPFALMVDIYIMSLSTGLRFCLKASSGCLEDQLHATADPPEGPVIVKQRLWHNERFPKITAWQRECILVDGSGWFLDVDGCLRPYPPHFLSVLDRFRKHEQPRWEWWEFLVGVHTFHLSNRENLLLDVYNRSN